MPTTPQLLIAACAVAVLLGTATPGVAEPVKCQRAIARTSAKFVQAKAQAIRKCEEGIVRGSTSGPCPDAITAEKIANAVTALSRGIAKACGGDDQQCGSDQGNEDTPASLGWPSACPGFEATPCAGSIDDCSGIIECTLCVAEAAVDQSLALLYDDLNLPSTGNATLNKCQRTLGRSTVKYLVTRSRLLQRCWDARLKDKHSAICPDPNDASFAAAIGKASESATMAICKACGGPDGRCDGTDNLTRAEIGFSFNCPNVQPIASAPCVVWNPTNGLSDLIFCGTCVADFKTDCTDRLAVPQFVGYPVGCGGGPQPTPQPCHSTGGLACSGECPMAQICLPVSDGVCGCVPDGSQPCGNSGYPVCNGTCPPGDTCGTSAIVGGVCLCGNPPCGDAPYPICGGDCLGTDQCVPGRVNGLEKCWCVPAGNVCGAGTCPPFGTCPVSQVCDFPSCTCGPE